MTSLITNADLKSGTSGWIAKAESPSGSSAKWTAVTSKSPAVMEAYAGWDSWTLASFSLTQQVELEAGTYRLQGYGFYRWGENADSDVSIDGTPRTLAYMVVADQKVAVNRVADPDLADLVVGRYPVGTSDASKEFAVGNYACEIQFTLNATTTVTLGYEGTHECARSWFCCGPMVLVRLSKNDVEYDWMNMQVTANLENDKVRAFLTDVYYNEASSSKISTYNSGLPLRKDQPRAITIPMPEHTGDLTLAISSQPDMSEAMMTVVSSEEETAQISNLIPQRTYYYKVKDDEQQIVSQGEIHTEGCLRMIRANSVSNIRDMGGWRTCDYQQVRYGRIYRGGEFNGINGHTATAADLALLHDLGIGAELDLRSATWDTDQSFRAISALGDDVNYRFSNQQDCDVLSLTADTCRVKWADNFRFIVANLQEGRAVYFHCVWGADRTGAMGFLLGGLMGMTVDELYKDYELTTFSEAGGRYKTGLDSKLAYIQVLPGRSLRDKFEGYFVDSLGIDPSLIKTFRDMMLEPSVAAISTARQDYEDMKTFMNQVIQLAETSWDTTEADALNASAVAAEDFVAAQEKLFTIYQDALQALDHLVDMTPLLTNADFSSRSTKGWNVTGASPKFSSKFDVAEIYEKEGRVSQILHYMPEGTYILTAQADQRTGKPDEAFARYEAGQSRVSSYLTFNTVRKAVCDAFDGAQANTVPGSDYESNPATGFWIPNAINAAGNYFKAGAYWNFMQAILADSRDLRIGIQATSTAKGAWTTFSNFHLYYGTAKNNAVLGDNEEYDAPATGTLADVTTRELKADRWNTLCLPFDITADRWEDSGISSAWQLEGVTDGIATFREVTDLRAGRPYLVKVEADGPIQLSDVLLTPQPPMTQPTDDGATMTGTYSPVTLQDIYFIANDNFYYADKEQTINGFRAYITLPTDSQVKALKIQADDSPTVGIGKLIVKKTNYSQTIYSIQGYRVQNAQRGLFVIDGKKCIVK